MGVWMRHGGSEVLTDPDTGEIIDDTSTDQSRAARNAEMLAAFARGESLTEIASGPDSRCPGQAASSGRQEQSVRATPDNSAVTKAAIPKNSCASALMPTHFVHSGRG